MDKQEMTRQLAKARTAAAHQDGDAMLDAFNALNVGGAFHDLDVYAADASIDPTRRARRTLGRRDEQPRQTATVRGPADTSFNAVVTFDGGSSSPSSCGSSSSSSDNGSSSSSCD